MAGEELLAERHAALDLEHLGNDFLRLERADERRLVLDRLLQLEVRRRLRGFLGNRRIGIVHRELHLLVEAVEIGQPDRLQDLDPPLRFLPALVDRLPRKLARLRASFLAGAQSEQGGIGPGRGAAVHFLRPLF